MRFFIVANRRGVNVMEYLCIFHILQREDALI